MRYYFVLFCRLILFTILAMCGTYLLEKYVTNFSTIPTLFIAAICVMIVRLGIFTPFLSVRNKKMRVITICLSTIMMLVVIVVYWSNFTLIY